MLVESRPTPTGSKKIAGGKRYSAQPPETAKLPFPTPTGSKKIAGGKRYSAQPPETAKLPFPT
ncbi:MAG TPA: hypothetical protein VLZ81_01925, partial [Blastocatellia bacterium]|nr:hypothetical protein [Blastocatellia bacterium]